MVELHFSKLQLAQRWYETGSSLWTRDDGRTEGLDIDSQRSSILFGMFYEERSEHRRRAEVYASARIGYAPGIMEISEAEADHRVIADLQFTLLEAAAAERRVLALSACITSTNLVVV